MAEFRYARGRIAESVQYISEEMREFENDYADRSWQAYREDKKLQKLMDRTVENILTALIEMSGTLLVEEGIAIDNYGEVLSRCAALFSFSEEERLLLSKLALQRNRLAHRYLNFRWQAIETYAKTKGLIRRLLNDVLQREEEKG